MIITKSNFPHMYEAIATMCCCNGLSVEKSYDVNVDVFTADDDAVLGKLTEEEMFTLCDGEESEIAELISRNVSLVRADSILNEVFGI